MAPSLVKTGTPQPQTQTRLWGVLAEFDSPTALYKAAELVRDAGAKKWDCYCPFPVHNLDEAMGLKPSRVSWIVGTGAAIGAGGGMLLQYYLSAVNYRIVVNGKPFWAWEQFMPVTFELGVLIAGFGAIIGMLALNGLPRHHHPLFEKKRFLKASDDGFFIAVQADDPNVSPTRALELFEQAGATHVEEVEDAS